jgi:hypothetical protein
LFRLELRCLSERTQPLGRKEDANNAGIEIVFAIKKTRRLETASLASRACLPLDQREADTNAGKNLLWKPVACARGRNHR